MPDLLTEAQKAEFLECIRQGGDNGLCAKQIGTTGTRIRKMVNTNTATYDHDFAIDYQKALGERDPVAYHNRTRGVRGDPQDRTLHGYRKAITLTPDDLDAFLDAIRAGLPKATAAHQIETSLVQINRLANRDQDFARRYAEALDDGYPVYIENLRSKAYELAMEGNYQPLKDLLLVHAEEYDKLRTSRHEVGGIGGGALKILAAHLPELPPHLLNELISQIEAKSNGDPKALEQQVIDQ